MATSKRNRVFDETLDKYDGNLQVPPKIVCRDSQTHFYIIFEIWKLFKKLGDWERTEVAGERTE